MSRRIAREIALQSLFQIDLVPAITAESALFFAENLHDVGMSDDSETEKKWHLVTEYAALLLRGTLENIESIDCILERELANWRLARIANVERSILRLCVFEIKFAPESTDCAIAINEAVEIAKKYCGSEGARFINGVLGKIVRGNVI